MAMSNAFTTKMQNSHFLAFAFRDSQKLNFFLIIVLTLLQLFPENLLKEAHISPNKDIERA